MTLPGSTRVSSAQAQSVWALTAILRRRRTIAVSAVGLAFLVGVLVLLLPRTYTARTSILPMTNRPTGNLAGLAATLGFTLSGADQSESPPFYADLVNTPTILIPVVRRPFRYPDSSAAPTTLEDLYRTRAGSDALRADRAVLRLKRDLHVTLNLRTGVVEIEVTMRDPALSRDVILAILDELNRYNLNRRQSQASAERQFTEQQAQEAKDSLTAAENRYENFLLTNRDTRSPDLKFEEDRLQRATLLRQQIYTTLMQAYEQARIEEVRNTPVLSIVEPPRVPALPDSRALALKVLIAAIVGGLVALVVVLAGASLSPAAAAAGPDDLLREWAATRDDLRHPLRAALEGVRGLRRRA